MTSRLSALFAVGVLLVVPGLALPRLDAEQAPSAHDSGIYVVTSGGEGETLVLIKASIGRQDTKNIGRSILTQGIVKPSVEAHISGLSAELRVPPGETTFYFYFPDPNQKGAVGPNSDPTAALVAMMSGGGAVAPGLPPTTKSANDFALIRLQPGADDRVADMGKSPGNKPKDPVGFVSERVSATQFRVKPKEPLAPGEYAFCVTAMGGGGQFWDFGVTAPK